MMDKYRKVYTHFADFKFKIFGVWYKFRLENVDEKSKHAPEDTVYSSLGQNVVFNQLITKLFINSCFC